MLRTLSYLGLTLIAAAIVAAAGAFGVLYHYGRGLPDYKQLATYEPPMVTRVHAADGRLLAEYSREKRVFVPIRAMPTRVIKAFLSAEDQNFYDHPGIDLFSLVRAAVTNVTRVASDRRPVGGSTITQQVAKNFLLTNELSIARKAKEAILAFRIERTLSKDRILELYMNEIYLGQGSYGVAAAALNYFNKALDDLTVAEAAYLAGLPKAPNNYHPVRHAEAAKARRDYVVRRMVEDGYLAAAEAAQAVAAPLVTRTRAETELVTAAYFAEEIRRELIARYGEERVYGGGLSVRTTLDPRLQQIAQAALRAGLIEYDRRHGWRGPISRVKLDGAWRNRLAMVERPAGLGPWRLAVVTDIEPDGAPIRLADGSDGRIARADLAWARPALKDQRVGPAPQNASEVLAPGDVIAVSPGPGGGYVLQQVPEVEGAVVALDPHTGRVLAMVGGFDQSRSEFNRATQAWRQPGSAFKPFVYLAALQDGFTPSRIILDAPIVVDQGPGLPKWRPANYNNRFAGAAPMRVGIEQSKNLMTVRLAQAVGIERVGETAERFGVVDRMPRMLSMSLGAGETTALRLTTAYAMLVNGGKRIRPTLIDRIQDRDGKTVFRHDARPCPECAAVAWEAQDAPEVPDTRERIADPASAYQIVSMLQGVVQRGTGRRLAAIGKPLAGKTGTTNDSEDTWFVGFTPDLVAGVFIGFDNPRTLGGRETGASAALPVFGDFMVGALKDKPAIPFRIPPGIRLVRVNSHTGQPARPGESDVILEAFKPGTEPSATSVQQVLDGAAPDSVAPSPADRAQPPSPLLPVGTVQGLY